MTRKLRYLYDYSFKRRNIFGMKSYSDSILSEKLLALDIKCLNVSAIS